IDNLWRFRDYIIASFNEDKPFDRLIQEHLAGDVIAPNDESALIGSAFLVAGPYDNVNNQDLAQKAQIRANTLDEMIRATSESFLGLTVGCARCHDHKFDPISQQDYYSLYATFAGVRHQSVPLITPQKRRARQKQLQPLRQKEKQFNQKIADARKAVLDAATQNEAEYSSRWKRPPVDRMGTTETFDPTEAKFVRLVCEAQDINLNSNVGFRIDEFEAWTSGDSPRNVALSSEGGIATGRARKIEDFPDAYGPHHVNDGKMGARFLSLDNSIQIEFAKPEVIDHVVFSSARGETVPKHSKFVFVAEYRIETSLDGKTWTKVADGSDRKPTTEAGPLRHRNHRLFELAVTTEQRQELAKLRAELEDVRRSISQVPEPPTMWMGVRNDEIGKGPFHVFLGGSPQRPGQDVVPASLSVLDQQNEANETFRFSLPAGTPEAQRRRTLAQWITDPKNPLTSRVLANRIWQHHFGTGIVSTPNDFGYMGTPPSHPELLDFLSAQLISSGWRIKSMHKSIMMSTTYRQSSDYRVDAAAIDGDSRLLWRFPPRRLSAEEVRDSVLQISGVWKRDSADRVSKDQSNLVPDGGPGFRLYHY
ncbi:MAG: DUF1553 domain-containing protein, partial [Planctomycetota bacterium]